MKNLSFVPKISMGIILLLSLAQWSCIEDIDPVEITPRNIEFPFQYDQEETEPITRYPDLPKPNDNQSNRRQIGQ
jgi:hypothetical protein